MPIYEYVCASCQHRFEVKQKMSDPPVSRCTRCGEAVAKVISAPAIMFKGRGWYITDYSDKMKPPGQTESAGQPSNGQKEPAGSKEAPAQPAAASPSPAQAGAAAGAGSGSSSTSSTGGSTIAAPSSTSASTSTSKPSSASSS
ncbi:MAG: zinc ribbon domain-containing protein [Nitrospirae bacterium]|nr:zinc ribbon domain-containing protein [Nitrospirota bacterium]